jgi:hypothetical protein
VIGIRQFQRRGYKAVRRSIRLAASLFSKQQQEQQVPKEPMDLVDQFRELEELFEALLELRIRVRRAERAAAEPANVYPKSKKVSPTWRKPNGHKRARRLGD